MRDQTKTSSLEELVPGRIWLVSYPIQYAGCSFESRMSVIRLNDGQLMLHSPCAIDLELRESLEALGSVAYIVAPGSYHHLHVASCQKAFPNARTWICPGVELKQPRLAFDGFLGDTAEPDWAEELEQVLLRGNRVIWEVAFFDRPSRTLLLVDLIENIGDKTPGTDRVLRFFWKGVMRMWNKARPAPEYQMGWKDRVAARASLERMLEWDFERIVIAHGDLIEIDAKAVAREAWQNVLSDRNASRFDRLGSSR